MAMLWEQWRLTRTEAAWRLALGTIGAAAVSALIAAAFPDSGPVNDFGWLAALLFIGLPHFMGWVSLQMLNWGRPGFPFPLRYTYPVRTWVMVGVPMAYVTALSAGIYAVSAGLLSTVFGYPFPLAAGAAWIASLNVMYAATNWWTRNPVVRLLGVTVISATWAVLAADGFNTPKGFDLPLAFYLTTAAVGLAAFGLTVAGVARQRHGAGGARTSWSFADIRDRLTGWFPFPCPTSSATRAQIWFEMRRRGLLLLTIAVALAIVNPLLFAVGVPIDAAITSGAYLTCRVDGCFYARAVALMFAALSVPGLLVLGFNAFGIRANQGRLHLSAFDATQPSGTGRLALLKVLVMLVSVLTALTVVIGSAWASGLFTAASTVFIGDPRFRPRPPHIEAVIGTLTGRQQFGLVVVTFIGVAFALASDAAFGAIKTRYPGRIGRGVSLLLLYGLTLAGLALAERGGFASGIPFAAILRATSWIAAGAIALATVYLFWRNVAERLMTPWQVCGVALAAGAIGAAWVAMLREVGTVLGGIVTVLLDADAPIDAVPAVGVPWMLWPVLMLLMISVLAPWSLSRIRHT